MKIFICNRSIDIENSSNIISELLKESANCITVFQEKEHSEKWQEKVKLKFEEVDFILFLVNENTFQSENIQWELEYAKKLSKPIVCIKLSSDIINFSIHHCEGIPIFDDAKQCYKYLKSLFKENQSLLLEQYKIMVASAEKVTEQRLKVNNLFFTVTSSILSVAFLVGKALEFSVSGIIGMLIFTCMALMTSYFWEKLINSYGNLNKGKFAIINKIENRLRTNIFEKEWKILTEEIKYESNSKTEIKIIKAYRIFIFLIGLAELSYIFYQVLLMPEIMIHNQPLILIL